MQLRETPITSNTPEQEGSQQVIAAPNTMVSLSNTPLELLILSWDQFVNELEFE